MKNSFVFAALLAFAFVCRADKPGDELTLSTSATLRDGSTIKGTLLTSAIKGGAIFADALELPLSVVKTIGFVNTNGDAKVSLVNGDTLSLAVTTPSFDLDSALGRLAIDRAKIRNLAITPRRAIAPTDAAGLVFHCTFDDEASVTSPAVGPAGRFLNGRFVEGKFEQSLYVPPYTSCAVFDFPSNFFGKAGCIELWFKIENTSSRVGAGGDPRLFCGYEKNNLNHMILNVDFVNNDGGGNSGVSALSLTGHTSSITGFGYNLSYQQLLGKKDWREWHHLALVWDNDNIPGMKQPHKSAVYIDGEALPIPVESGRNSDTLNRLFSSDYLFCIPNNPDQDTERNSKSPYRIDELKIWNYAKTDFCLQ